MAGYEFSRIRKLAESLAENGVAQELIDQILEGGEEIRQATPPEKKADWFREAMRRMDNLLDKDLRHAVREDCACCLGGKRFKLVKEIAKKGGSLEERIAAANETKLVFGHSVTLEDDGKILVRFAPDDQAENHCVCLRNGQVPVSITYCYCCGGHIKHHLQTALDRSLDLKVRSSALSSGGKRPCTFLFTIKEN